MIRPTRIKDLSDRRRLPRLGKIRLGVKAVSRSTGNAYPKETSYFVVPPEVEKVTGPQPTELNVMFPLDDIDQIFPQCYAWYGRSRGPKCMGDGEFAQRVNEETKSIDKIPCPCEKLESKECARRASLLVMLPDVSVGGIYQIDMGSYHSIVDINSGLDYVTALIGRFRMVPLKLKRVPRETHGSGRKETHYTLTLTFDGDINTLNFLRENTKKVLSSPRFLLEAPVLENPVLDEEAVVEMVEEEEVPTDVTPSRALNDEPDNELPVEIGSPATPDNYTVAHDSTTLPAPENSTLPPKKDFAVTFDKDGKPDYSNLHPSKFEGQDLHMMDKKKMTPEEVKQTLMQFGLVDNGSPKKEEPKPPADPNRPLGFADFKDKIARFEDLEELMKWFDKDLRSARERIPKEQFTELVRLVNQQMGKLQKKKGRK